MIRVQAPAGELAAARAAEASSRARPRPERCGCTRETAPCLALGFGQTQEALDAFDLAFAERDPALVWLARRSARRWVQTANARFQAMLEKLGLD